MKSFPFLAVFLPFLLLCLPYLLRSQQRYQLPTFEVLEAQQVSQIDVYEQRIHTLTNWNQRDTVDSTDRKLGERSLIARYFINANGKVDSVDRWDTTGRWIDRTRILYDVAWRYTHIEKDDTAGAGIEVQTFQYTDTGMLYERHVNGKWQRKSALNNEAYLLLDHVRTERDSGLYRYIENQEAVINIAFRDGALAYRNELRYLMKDGMPDSLYYKSDYYLPAFETYRLEGIGNHVEGTVDVLKSGEAVVPEYSPLFGSIETGFTFGQHRTLLRMLFPYFYPYFQLAELVYQSRIWPTFVTPNHIRRSYFEMEYRF